MMITDNRILAGITLTLAAATWIDERAVAQSFVWPPGYANQAANSSQETPFSVSPNIQPRGSRSTVLMSAQTLTQLQGKTITAIAFRRDHQYTGTYPAFSGTIDVRMGPVHSAVHVVRSQRDPFSEDPTRVAWGNFSVPAAPYTTGIAPFQLVIDFDEPYLYTGGDLAIDILFESSTTAIWRRDALWINPGNEGRLRTIGSGIPGSNGRTPFAAVDPGPLHPGGQLITRAEALPLPNGQLVVHTIGNAGPAYPLTNIGMPAGTLLHLAPLVDALITSADRARGFTRAWTVLPLPNDPTLPGMLLTTQMIVLDPLLGGLLPANVTNAVEFEIGTPPGPRYDYGRTIWARGSDRVLQDVETRMGPVDYVPIIEFRY